MADTNPDIKRPVDNAWLAEIYRKHQAGDKLASHEGEMLEAIDTIQDGVALLARPLVINLANFLAKPSGAFPSHGLPPKANEAAYQPSADSGVTAMIGAMAQSAEQRDLKSGKPPVPTADNARVFGVMPSLIALSEWAQGCYADEESYVTKRINAQLVLPTNWGQSIVLNFGERWYVCALLRDVGVSFPHAPVPTVSYYACLSRETALETAYRYARCGQLPQETCNPPQELFDAYKQAQAAQATYRQFLQAKQEVKGEPLGATGAFFAAREPGAPPSSINIWYA